jgi:hypothetical protein
MIEGLMDQPFNHDASSWGKGRKDLPIRKRIVYVWASPQKRFHGGSLSLG